MENFDLYHVGAMLTAIVAILTIYFIDMSKKDRLALGTIFAFGLASWPIMLVGLGYYHWIGKSK